MLAQEKVLSRIAHLRFHILILILICIFHSSCLFFCFFCNVSFKKRRMAAPFKGGGGRQHHPNEGSTTTQKKDKGKAAPAKRKGRQATPQFSCQRLTTPNTTQLTICNLQYNITYNKECNTQKCMTKLKTKIIFF